MLRPAIAASFCRKLYGAYSVTRYRLKLQSRRRRTDYEGPDGQRQEGAGGVAAGARHDVEQLVDASPVPRQMWNASIGGSGSE